MLPLTRQAQRIRAGTEDATPGVADPVGWLLTVNPAGPQSGSVNMHDGSAHYISEALADGGVLTQDRRILNSLVGLGAYLYQAAPSGLKYARTVLVDNPSAYYRLAEAANNVDSTTRPTAADQTGLNNGVYLGANWLAELTISSSLVALWLLGESGNQRVAVDYRGAQTPNLVTNPNFEADTAGWGANAYCTISQYTADRAIGSASLLVTQTSITDPYSSTPVPAVVGQTYTVSVWVKPSTNVVAAGAADRSLMLDRGGGGPFVALSSLTPNVWQRVSVTAVALGTPINVRLYNLTSGPGTVLYDGVMVTLGSTTPASFYEGSGGNDGDYEGSFTPNLAPYPSFENNSYIGWASGGSAGTPTVDATQGFSGTHSARSVSSAAGTMGFPYMDVGNSSYLAPVVPGQIYSAGVYLKADAAYTGTWSLQIYFYTSALALLTTPNGAAVAPSTGWQRVTCLDQVAPATAAYARIIVTRVAAAAGEAVNADAAMIVVGPVLPPYSDTRGVTLGQVGPLVNNSDTAVQLDGQSGYIRVPYSAAINPGHFTYSGWVKFNATGAYNQALISTRGNNQGILLWDNGGQINCYLYDGTTQHEFSSSASTISAGQWYHIAITYDGSTATLYINGVSAASLSAFTTYVPQATGAMTIGSDGTNYYLNGVMMGWAVNNLSLSAQAMLIQYKTGVQTAITFGVTEPVQDSPTVSGGSWVGNVGGLGYVLCNFNSGSDAISLPGGGSVAVTKGSRFVWTTGTSDTRALQNAAGTSRNATGWYDTNYVQATISLNSPFTGTVSVYVVDWDNTGRRENVTVNGQTASVNYNFHGGAWLSFQLVGVTSISIIVTNTAGVINAVIQGIFFGVSDAISVDGAVGAVNVPYSSSLPYSPFSYEGWLSPVVNQGQPTIAAYSSSWPNNGWWIKMNQACTAITMDLMNGTEHNLTTAAGAIGPGAWHHVVTTYDGATGVIYVDGVQKIQGALAAPSAVPSNGVLALGSWIGAQSGDYMGGGMDEVAIYDYALAASQVAAHYSAQWN